MLQRVLNTVLPVSFSLLASISNALGQDNEPIPEVVITATRIERALFETPQAVTVLNDQEVEEANVSNTPDLFRFAEGVYIQKTNLGGGSPFIRGLTGKQVLILVDGVRLNNSFYRFGPHQYLNTIDPNIIERIEVVRGPASVLYGSDALGGVINVITRRRQGFSQPLDWDALLHGVYDSSVDGGSGRAQIEGNHGDFGWVGGYTGKSYDDLEGGGDIGEQDPSGYSEYDADLKFNWRFDPQQEFIFAAQYARQEEVPKTSEVTLCDKLKFDYEPQERQLYYLEYLGKHLGIFDQMKVNFSYNWQEEGEEIIRSDSPDVETQEVARVQTPGATVQLTNRLGERHRLTYGLDYYRDEYDTRKGIIDLVAGVVESVPAGTPDDATYESLGIYLQDEFRISKRFEAILGLRYSGYAADGTIEVEDETQSLCDVTNTDLNLNTDQWTASLNGLFRLTPRWNVVAGWAQGFRAPNMEDLFGRVDFFNECPNTELEPEESDNWEVGAKYYSGRTSAEVYYFRSDYDNLIERVTIGTNPDDSPIKQRRNIKEARIMGVEAAINHEFNPRWLVKATATWTNGEDRDTSEPLRRIPPLNGTLRLRYTHNPKFWGELLTEWAEEQDDLSQGDIDDPRIPEGGTPGYAVLHLKASYERTGNEQLLVTLQNLGDKEYKTHGSGIFSPGRSLIVSYRLALPFRR